MDRYYKINRNSETGQKLAEVLQKANEFLALKREFVSKYSIKYVYESTFYVDDIGCVKFHHLPDDLKDNWKHGEVQGTYTLKAKPKNQKLKKEWDSLLSKRVKRYEIDRILGCKSMCYHAGLDATSDEWFLIVTEHSEIYDFPTDVLEISNLEYHKILHPTKDIFAGWSEEISVTLPTDRVVKGLKD